MFRSSLKLLSKFIRAMLVRVHSKAKFRCVREAAFSYLKYIDCAQPRYAKCL